MDARDILRLLAARHSNDVFVEECKSGETWRGGHVRLDAWAMPKSWANPACTGYEIKVARSDFLRDEKWQSYLPLCNFLYFVCPAGIIKPEEIPESTGLLLVAKTGTKIYTKKRAPHRDVTIPESLFRYVLMRASQINGPDRYSQRGDLTAYWQQWLRQKIEKQDLGHMVRGRISEIYSRIQAENIRLKAANEGYERIRERLTELGFRETQHVTTWEFNSRIKDLITGMAPELLREVKSSIRALEAARNTLEEIQPGKG